ncbi:MAG: uracil-DNA glycosylase [Chloroflexota bacterium]
MIRRHYDGPLTGPLGALARRIVACRACPRLVDYREHVALEARKPRYAHQEYWGAPVPGHGDPDARVLLVGLAPASHGANRTGRLFTGDPSADFLTAALHRTGFASAPISAQRGDGFRLLDVFNSAAVRCAPPADRPTTAEQHACRPFLSAELGLLPELRVVLALGRLAHDACLRALRERSGLPLRGVRFTHGALHALGEGLPVLADCYHPSPRNTNTGRLSPAHLDAALRAVRACLNERA